MRAVAAALFSSALILWGGGCARLTPSPPGPLFGIPLAVEDADVGPALLDTGGGFEVMLRESFGLDIVGSAEVLAFGGFETVGLTRSFNYNAGGVDSLAEAAIVGVSSCDCNAVGFRFLRKTASVLIVDFASLQAGVIDAMPEVDFSMPFDPPPSTLQEFDTSFIVVDVKVNGSVQTITALLDTGANRTVFRRELVPSPSLPPTDRTPVTVTHPTFGSATVTAMLFDTPRLPDMIIGTDLMDKWADVWYFEYARESGQIGVIFNKYQPPAGDATSVVSRGGISGDFADSDAYGLSSILLSDECELARTGAASRSTVDP